ncbi:MAG TPA: WD40 repeat domain-containing protein [Gemmataceae bacterium]|nr:WD40 repeat domain-containing protein [Gemmataceae bacterium]
MPSSSSKLILMAVVAGLIPLVSGQAPATKNAQDDPLPKGALERFGSMALRHDGVVSTLAWSHDGTWLASGSHDKTICIWDAKTGQRLKRFVGHTDAVFAIAVSLDSKKIASASRDKTVRVWDVPTGKELWKSDAHGDAVCCVAFSPDGMMLASGGADEMVRMWDVATGKQLWQKTGSANVERFIGEPQWGVQSVVFSPDGKTLASGGLDRAVHLWDAQSGKNIRDFATEPPNAAHGVAFSPDGKMLAAATTANPGTQLWDVATGNPVVPSDQPYGPASNVTFSRDGKTLILCPMWGNVLRFPDVKTGWNPPFYRTSCPVVLAVVLSPDNATLACAGNGPTIELLDTDTGANRFPAADPQELLQQVTKPRAVELPQEAQNYFPDRRVISDNGSILVGVDRDAILHVWDLTKGKEIKQFSMKTPGPRSTVYRLALSPDGSLLAIERFSTITAPPIGSLIEVWDLPSGKRLHGIYIANNVVHFTFSADGRSLVTTDTVGAVSLWDMATGLCRLEWTTQLQISHCAKILPGGRLLATWVPYRVDDPRPTVHDFDIAPRYREIAWSPAPITLWDLYSGKRVTQFAGHVSNLQHVELFAGGKKLASVGWEGLGYCWALPESPKASASKLTEKQMESLWATLAADHTKAPDAVKEAYAAQAKLMDSGKAVQFLKQRLRPGAKIDAKAIDAFRLALESEKFKVREKATSELKALGQDAEPILQLLWEGNHSLELRQRIQLLMKDLETGQGALDRLRQDRALEILERINDADARDLLKSLAKGAPGMWLTRQAQASLDRLTALD